MNSYHPVKEFYLRNRMHFWTLLYVSDDHWPFSDQSHETANQLWTYQLTLNTLLLFSRVNCCMFAPAGWLLVTGSSSGDLLLFNVYNGQLLKSQLSTHDMGVTALALDPLSVRGSGAYEQFKMASTGNDAIIRLWTIRYSGTKPSSSKLVGINIGWSSSHHLLPTESVSFVLDALLEGHSAAVYSCSYHPTQPLLASGWEAHCSL